jgi:cation:H+ antiporter
MFYLILYLVLLIFFSFLLIKSTEILIGSLNRLSRASRISKFGLTSFLLAFATSLPEVFVGITAALEKKPSLALGNVLGSNIADLTLVIGGASVIGGSIGIIGSFIYQDLLYVFLAGILPLLMLIDSRLTRVEGLLLLAIYGVYNYTVLKRRKMKRIKRKASFRKLLKRLNHSHSENQLAWLFFGTALLIFSADGIVKTAAMVAQKFQVPIILIGLFLVAVGTSLPELSFEIAAVRKKQVAMVFGDLLGSIVANSTLVLGITCLISPIVLDGGFKVYFWATIAFLVVFFFFWLFVRTKKKLERWEGVILLLMYFAFIFFEFWRVTQHQAEAFFSTPMNH